MACLKQCGNYRRRTVFTIYARLSPGAAIHARKPRQLQRKDLESLIAAGLRDGKSPEQILASLPTKTVRTTDGFEYETTQLTKKDVNNVLALIKRMSRLGFSDTELALKDLEASPDWFHRCNEEDGHLTQLFLMHRKQRELFRKYHFILEVDGTHKTSIHGLHMIDIIGIDNVYGTFPVAHLLTRSASEEFYTWGMSVLREICEELHVTPGVFITDRELAMMNTLEAVFPQSRRMLCTWHINEACKAYITGATFRGLEHIWGPPKTRRKEKLMSRLREVEQEPSEVQMEILWARPKQDLGGEDAAFVKYYTETWYSKLRQLYMRCFTKDIFSGGHTTTQRTECWNGVQKRELGCKSLLMDVVRCLTTAAYLVFDANQQRIAAQMAFKESGSLNIHTAAMSIHSDNPATSLHDKFVPRTSLKSTSRLHNFKMGWRYCLGFIDTRIIVKVLDQLAKGRTHEGTRHIRSSDEHFSIDKRYQRLSGPLESRSSPQSVCIIATCEYVAMRTSGSLSSSIASIARILPSSISLHSLAYSVSMNAWYS